MTNILSLDSAQAKSFFFDHESYSNIDLPPYFKFEKLINKIEKLYGSAILDLDALKRAQRHETVNHVLYGNKDGKYSWRKYEIINPLIYVSLVNLITQKNNWKLLKESFKRNERNKYVECVSIPVIKVRGIKRKAAQITEWVENVEKKSIYLSLEYKFLYQTDIADYYPSIYTHSIPWAIHTKNHSKSKRGYEDLLGNKIDCHIQAMSYGQTNGIPQGSVLMDFISEVVLSYADNELSEKLKTRLKDKRYHILRFRDDFRIFVNDTNDGDIILKSLSETLISLGLKLNTPKKNFYDNIISGSVKKDKLYDLVNEPVPKAITKKELLRQLLIIQQISMQFPNTGTIKRRLAEILEHVKLKNFYSQEKMIAGLLVDIGYNNPISFPTIAVLISMCVSKLTFNDKKDLLHKIHDKVCMLSNIGLLEIWMQRISVNLRFPMRYNEKLCKLVTNTSEMIFETSWITNSRIKKLIDSNIFVDKKEIAKSKSIIDIKEVQIFDYYN